MKSIYRIIAIVACSILSLSISAQNVNTLYFLENAPTRHTINPAFQPISNVYVLLPVIGNTNLSFGNNAFTMKDLIFQDPTTGQTITALHPNAEGILWGKLPEKINIDADIQLNLVSFGARVGKQKKGYFHVNISEHIGIGMGMPKTVLGPLLGQGLNNINLNSINIGATVYSEAAVGYSHIINEQWAVGAKLKFIVGHAFMKGYFNELSMNSTQEEIRLHGDGNIQVAGLITADMLEGIINGTGLSEEYFPTQFLNDIKPSAFGGAIDLGVTYKPIKQLQISASVTDLGLIHWSKGGNALVTMDTTFTGMDEVNYEDYTDSNGDFQSNQFMEDMTENIVSYLDALQIHEPENKPFTQMLTANLHVGVDANFWKNRIGIGVYSHTRFFPSHVTEEVTIGASFRPFRCFNLAASYSFINGRWSNLGVGLSIAPYDGIMITATTDYLPLSFAAYQAEGQTIQLPYQTGCVNATIGLAVVIGTSKKKNR